MYIVTQIEIINGEKVTVKDIRGAFFRSVAQIDNYQYILQQQDTEHTILLSYKCPVSTHVKWPKYQQVSE